MKKFLKHFRYGQKGFTLIELLVVIGILGAIAAVVVPNVGSFIGRGKTEAQATELHNVQTSVMAMLVDSASGELDGIVTTTADMSTVLATSPDAVPPATGDLALSAYLTGLGSDDPTTPAVVETADPPIYVKTGCTYAFDVDGTVTQTVP
jgi:prepilin-type N-terminal cleavage/methylation domain-containing protein